MLAYTSAKYPFIRQHPFSFTWMLSVRMNIICSMPFFGDYFSLVRTNVIIWLNVKIPVGYNKFTGIQSTSKGNEKKPTTTTKIRHYIRLWKPGLLSFSALISLQANIFIRSFHWNDSKLHRCEDYYHRFQLYNHFDICQGLLHFFLFFFFFFFLLLQKLRAAEKKAILLVYEFPEDAQSLCFVVVF